MMRWFFVILTIFLSLNIWSSSKLFSHFNHKNTDQEIEEILKTNSTKLLKELKLESFKDLSIFIRIIKEDKTLEIWSQSNQNQKYSLMKSYPICYYSGDLGPKTKEGDKQSPEGFYSVNKSSLNPKSSFHLSFNLGYPNEYDRSYKRTGNYLMVHGSCVSVGCYAMTDKAIEEIYTILHNVLLNNNNNSIPVHIFPFKMTAERMKLAQDTSWFDFWTNLKEGWDFFEKNKTPPKVKVQNKKYIISN